MNLNVWKTAEVSYHFFKTNSVVYRCEYCYIEFQVDAVLFHHIDKVHKVPKSKYIKDNPHFAKSKSNQKCQICEKKYRNLDKHLKMSHEEMEPEIYFIKYHYLEMRQTNKFYAMDTYQDTPGEHDNASEHDEEGSIAIQKDAEDPNQNMTSHSLELQKSTMNTHNDLETLAESDSSEEELIDQLDEKQSDTREYSGEETPDNGENTNFESQNQLDENMDMEEVDDGLQIKSETEEQLLEEHDQGKTETKPITRTYNCELCSKVYKSRAGLFLHTNVHSGYKSFNCDLCDKTFGRKDVFEDHVHFHTGKKLFKCPKCDKDFGVSASFRSHKSYCLKRKP